MRTFKSIFVTKLNGNWNIKLQKGKYKHRILRTSAIDSEELSPCVTKDGSAHECHFSAVIIFFLYCLDLFHVWRLLLTQSTFDRRKMRLLCVNKEVPLSHSVTLMQYMNSEWNFKRFKGGAQVILTISPFHYPGFNFYQELNFKSRKNFVTCHGKNLVHISSNSKTL